MNDKHSNNFNFSGIKIINGTPLNENIFLELGYSKHIEINDTIVFEIETDIFYTKCVFNKTCGTCDIVVDMICNSIHHLDATITFQEELKGILDFCSIPCKNNL